MGRARSCMPHGNSASVTPLSGTGSRHTSATTDNFPPSRTPRSPSVSENWSARTGSSVSRSLFQKSDCLLRSRESVTSRYELTATEPPPSYAPAVDERELYVHMLLASRSYPGRRIGSGLLDHAREQARARDIPLVRVDCWSGGDGALIRYHESQGFTPTERVPVGERELQVRQSRACSPTPIRPRPTTRPARSRRPPSPPTGRSSAGSSPATAAACPRSPTCTARPPRAGSPLPGPGRPRPRAASRPSG